MSQPSQVIVLVEDGRHKRLLYRYLKMCGLQPHAIRIELSPPGEGSAERWVTMRFPHEVRAYRRRHAATVLIAMIDADLKTTAERLAQLDRELIATGTGLVQAEERITTLVPRRNVET